MTKKESDEDFLKRISELREKSEIKSKKESKRYVKEYEEGKKTGKLVGTICAELDECYKIIEEFKKNPPILITKHVNGVSIERKYDEKFKSKVELLKKHLFPINSVTHDTSIFSPYFKTFGKTYVKRGIKKILLPKNSTPPTIKGTGMGSQAINSNNIGLILEDDDIIITEDNSYVSLNDIESNDKYKREIFILPNSEMRIKLLKKTTDSEPEFMDPSRVSEIVKRESKRTIISSSIVNFNLIKGIFKINLISEKLNPNKIIKIDSNFPSFDFLHSSTTYEEMLNKAYEKIAHIPEAAKIIAKHKTQKRCEEISAYLELCDNNSVVIFGTMNAIKHKESGKIATINMHSNATKDFVIPGKITVFKNKIYSDKSDNIDPRVKAVMKYGDSIGVYNTMLETINELESKLKSSKEIKLKKESVSSIKEKEMRMKELLEESEYMKNVGDKEMSDAIQMQIDEINNPQITEIVNEEYMQLTIKNLNKEIEKLKPYMNSNFPSYNSLSEKD